MKRSTLDLLAHWWRPNRIRSSANMTMEIKTGRTGGIPVEQELIFSDLVISSNNHNNNNNNNNNINNNKNSDLKNKYNNARSNESNSSQQPNPLQLTAADTASRSSVVKDHNSNVSKRSSSHCSDPINSYGRDRDPNTPPLEGRTFKHFGGGSVRKHAQCHSYSNSLNRHQTRRLSRNKSNGR